MIEVKNVRKNIIRSVGRLDNKSEQNNTKEKQGITQENTRDINTCHRRNQLKKHKIKKHEGDKRFVKFNFFLDKFVR